MAEESLSPQDSHLTTLDAQFIQAMEVALEQSGAAFKAIGERMDQYEAVLLFIATQPWPRDKDACPDWASLVKHIHTELAKGQPKGFRETVPVRAPIDKMVVRDLL